MVDYRKMYAFLCGEVSDTLDILPNTAENTAARAKLEQALLRAEAYYIENAEETENTRE